MSTTRSPEPGGGRLALGRARERSPSRSGRRHSAYRQTQSFFDHLAPDIRPPIVRACVSFPPFLRGLAFEQFGQREPGDRSMDHDIAVAGLDLDPLPIVEAGRLGDISRKADRQVLTPPAHNDLCHGAALSTGIRQEYPTKETA